LSVIKKIEEWDFKVFLTFYNSDFCKKKIIKDIAKVYSFFGGYYFWGGVWLFLGLLAYFTNKDYYLFYFFTGAFDQAFIIYVVIRYGIVKRNRPYVTLKEHGVEQHDQLIKESKSFPSGHVTFFLYFGFIFAFYFQNWSILLIFIILDIIMAFTRMILGVHFPTDVIFGFIFGAIFAWLYLYLTYPYWISFYYRIEKIYRLIKNLLILYF